MIYYEYNDYQKTTPFIPNLYGYPKMVWTIGFWGLYVQGKTI